MEALRFCLEHGIQSCFIYTNVKYQNKSLLVVVLNKIELLFEWSTDCRERRFQEWHGHIIFPHILILSYDVISNLQFLRRLFCLPMTFPFYYITYLIIVDHQNVSLTLVAGGFCHFYPLC
jgi:hypothetical protein